MAAEKAEEKQDQPAPSAKGKLKPIIIVAALMIGEGIGIYLLTNFISPDPDLGNAEEIVVEVDPFESENELKICETQATNSKEGKTYGYHLEVSAIVAAENKEMVERFVEARAQSIRDRIQTIIRSADPEDLKDPALQVIKRQLKFELNNLLSKELIEEVLIPNMIRSRTHL